MESTHTPAPRRRALKILAALLAAAVLILAGGIWAVWHNELATLASLKQIRPRDDSHQDGSVYQMEVHGGFYLEEFLAQGGVKTDSELIAFITSHITKGLLDMGIEAPEIACSSFTAQTAEGDYLFARNYDFSKTNTCVVFTEGGNGRHATVSTTDLQFLGIDVDRDVESFMDKVTCLAAPYTPWTASMKPASAAAST